LTGSTISHYQILEKLGSGGMGDVYKAQDERLKRFVALKFLPTHLTREPDQRARFTREAHAAASLNHPNISTIYEVDEVDGQPFIAMELVNGETLSQMVERGPLPVDDLLDITIQAARGLAAAHEAGIVHRDIKGANIMVRQGGSGHDRHVKVMDFGLAQLAAAPTQLTKEGMTPGTIAYMSPEQGRGEKVDSRTDIWALGVVLYEMVTGKQPFRAEYEQAVLYSILNEKPEPLSTLRPTVPKELERVVAKTLEKEADARYQSSNELLDDLLQLQRSRGSGSIAHDPPPEEKKPPWAMIWVLAASLAVAGFWLSRPNEPRSSATSETLRSAPLTSYPGSEIQPTFSPDGNQVAFSWNGPPQEQFDIYVKVVGSGEPLKLTSHPADEIASGWSPDGRWIAFIRGFSSEAELYLISPLGGRERKLADLELGTYRFSQLAWPPVGWSPDAKTVYFRDDRHLVAIDVSTGEKTSLTSNLETYYGDDFLAVSPDGSQLAFVRMLTGMLDGIYLMPAEGGAAREILAPGPRSILGLSWSQSGRELIYTESSGPLYRLALDGSPPQTLIGLGNRVESPAVAARGERLVYAAVAEQHNIWRYPIAPTGQQADGPASRKIAASTLADSEPQISPDGERIVFRSARSGGAEIWVASLANSSAIQLTETQAPVGSPRWSPDGLQIAFDGQQEGSWDIYVVDADRRGARLVVGGPGEESRPSWSHDGRWIYFNTARSGRQEVWKAETATGELVQITSNGGYHPMESPDGSWLYYTKPDVQQLWRRPAAGGAEELVLEHLLTAVSGHFDPANDGVYFLALDGDAYRTGWRLKFQPLDSSESHVVFELPGPPGQAATPLDVASDGTWFAYAQADEMESDLMLVEGFR